MCIMSTPYVVQCCEQELPEFGITVMILEKVEQVHILDFCILLIHFMTENTFKITGLPDNCTEPNTQFNVQIDTNHFAQSITPTSPFSMVNTQIQLTQITCTLPSGLYTSCHLTSPLLAESNRVRAITEITATM